MSIRTVTPQFEVGDNVTLLGRRHGTIAAVYDNALVPMWYGAERVIHTHCYEICLEHGVSFWGAVDAELTQCLE